MTFQPGREGRWEYADQTVEAIEAWNCGKGHGCTHGAGAGDPARDEFGPGGVCNLIARIFLQEPIEEMDDDGKRVTCLSYEPRPDPRAPVIPAGQLTIDAEAAS